MYTMEDVEREEAESAWIDEITVEAISDFQVERLVSNASRRNSAKTPCWLLETWPV